MLKVFVLIFLFSLVKANQEKIVCRNEINGEELDWFTLYKLPKEHEHHFTVDYDSIVELNTENKYYDETERARRNLESESNPYLEQGTAYTFITNKSQTKWQISSLSINDTNSMPGKTLEQFYSGDDPNMGYILYNDQTDKVSIIRGHTKGIILFNEKSAVWIVHSIPKYPPKKSDRSYMISPSQCIFGQSMLCMSFNFDQLEPIGRQLLFNFPQIYDSYVPESLKNHPVLSNLIRSIQGEHVKQPPWFNIENLKTMNNEQLISFAKFTNYYEDLYSGLVAPNLKSSLLTETWSNGAGTLRSNCSKELDYHVMNIEHLYFDFISLKFSVHHDHSKWAITTSANNDSKANIACIGDINRQSEQFKRGGGTICFANNKNVWSLYNQLVSDVETCPNAINNSKRNSFHIKKFEYENNEKIILL